MTGEALSEPVRIVVTGLGIVCPLGSGVEHVWARLCEGRSGIRSLDDSIVPDVACKVAGVVPGIDEDPVAGLDLDAIVAPKDQKKMDRFIQFAIVAAEEAIGQAGWHPSTDHERERSATVIGSGIGGYHAFGRAISTTTTVGTRRLSPFTVPSFLANLAAGWVSIRHGFRGPTGTPVTACAAGVQAIGDAARLLRAGEADIALCGGSEACIGRMGLGGFVAARAMSTHFNDRPSQASRPFDDARDGFVMGEGAGMLVIETLAHARARGSTPIVELLGYGTSSDAFHLTGGPADGEGAVRAMRAALAQANVSAASIDHVNAHSTSTPLGDRAELNALGTVFGRDGGPAICSTKSSTGHLLGAAGGIETVFSVLALRDGIVPPTRNLISPDKAAEGLDLVATQARPMTVDHVLSNGFGFGGVNACVVLGQAPYQ